MNYFNRLIIVAAASMLVAACDNAVKTNVNVSYLIKGSPNSALYPLDVRQDNEDVRIQLKEAAPAPEIVSIDAEGHEVAFNFVTEGDTLIVPGKFEHLRLRHEGVDATDILRKEAGK